MSPENINIDKVNIRLKICYIYIIIYTFLSFFLFGNIAYHESNLYLKVLNTFLCLTSLVLLFQYTISLLWNRLNPINEFILN